ncbi:hypothetical protein ACOMCU_00850 [Lysinibacillus sp. UGB7]
MAEKKVEGYLVSKNFDRFFMAFLLIGGIVLFVVFPLLVLMN